MNNKVVVVGSYIQDLAFRVGESLPKNGETLMGSFTTGCGGKGFNSAVASSRMGIQTLFISSVGRDAYSEALFSFCKKEDLDLSIEVHDYPTGAASIWVDAKGNNRIIVDIGANKLLSESHIITNETSFRDAKVVMAQLECNLDAVKLSFDIAKRKNRNVINILNTAPILNSRLDKDIFNNVDIVIANETEFDDITKTFFRQAASSCNDAFDIPLKELAHLLKLNAVVVTLGKNGAVIYDRMSNKYSAFKAPVVNVIDTAGAGDCFCGTFAAKLNDYNSLNEENLKAITYKSILNASLSTMKRGTAPSMPTLSEFNDFKNSLLERTIYPN